MVYDLVIIGGGPAGISAGIYGGRAKLKTLIIEKENVGGQIRTTHEMVNYPGILQTTGSQYMETLRKQALDFNVNFKEDEVVDLNLDNDIKIIKTKKEEIQARVVIFATGASPRKLGFKGEEQFTGRGVAYCATCDGEFFKGLDVFVIGGGYAAAEEALFLTKFAKKVIIAVREENFSCAKTIVDKVKSNNKIEVLYNTELQEVGGEEVLSFAKFKNNKSGETFEYHVNEEDGSFGVFVFIGYKPQTELLKGKVDLNEQGYVLTDEDMKTNLDGVYAAGDLRPKSLRQVVTAVSDGAIAATSAERYVSEQKHRLGIVDEEVVEDVKIEDKSKNIKKESTTDSINIDDRNRRSKLLNDGLRNQIKSILAMMENEVTLVSIVDESIDKSVEFMDLILDMASLGDKLNVEIYKKSENPEIEEKTIECDYHEIERCIINIVSNAAKYTPEGGTITVGIKDLDDKVMINIKDTGCGIDEKFHEAIFNRFSQASEEDYKIGSGLGLTITKQIIDLHKGEIYVESKLGEGSNFVIILPTKPELN